jgi:hypothetical protein
VRFDNVVIDAVPRAKVRIQRFAILAHTLVMVRADFH